MPPGAALMAYGSWPMAHGLWIRVFVVFSDSLYNTLTYRKVVSIGIRRKRAIFSGETI